MKTALIQMPVNHTKQDNLEIASNYISIAAKENIDIAILPEMFCCPYETSYFPEYAEAESGPTFHFLSRLAKENNIYLVAGSLPEKDNMNRVYNTSYVFDRQGMIIAKHRKMHLFDIDIDGGQYFKESDTLSAGNQVTVFDTEFGKIGLAICYDIRFPELSRLMVQQGAKIIVVPAAFNMTTGPAHWEILFRSRAVDNQVYMLGISSARNTNSSYVSYGNSIVVSPWGDIVQRLDEKEGLIITEIDIDYVDKIRNELPLLKHRRTDIYSLYKNNNYDYTE